MENTLLTNGFKEECNELMKKNSEYIISTIVYNPVTYTLNMSFKRNDNMVNSNEAVLELSLDIKLWYTISNVKLMNIIAIVSCNNIMQKDITSLYSIILNMLSVSSNHRFMSKLDTLSEIYTTVNNAEDGVTVELRSTIKDKVDTLTLEEYILNKDDVPYFKLKSDNTMIIPCNVLLERFIKILD